jgi:hypothetical protein
MGSWGFGLQQGDTPLDALGAAGLCDVTKERARTLNGIRGGKIALKDVFKKAAKCDSNEWGREGVLAVAEVLLDEGIDLTSVRKVINKALRFELSAKRIQQWTEPQERKAALQRFKDRLDGKKVKVVDQDHEGLMATMDRKLGGRSK